MKILIDTQVFLWLIEDNPLLSKKAKKIFLSDENDFNLSLASIWEISIKHSIGKLTIKQPLEKFLHNQLHENHINLLPINFRHVTKVSELPFHHRDPFDRLLIAQAIEEKFPILSSDLAFDKYEIKRLW